MGDCDDRRRGVKTCIVLGCLLFAGGLLMLTLAYHGVGDHVWEFRSRFESTDRPHYGYWIELLRLLLFVPLAMMALATGFARPLSKLLAVTDRSSWTAGVTLGRLLLLGLAAGFGGWNLQPCFDRTARGLAYQSVAYGHEHDLYAPAAGVGLDRLDLQFASARRAALFYSGYAAVFFAALVPLVVVVPGYAFLSEDIHRVLAAQRFIHRSVLQLAGLPPAERLVRAKRRFQRFRKTLTRLTTRHVRLMAAVGVAVAFDQYLGALAMSREAQTNVFLAYGIVCANGLLLCIALYFYYDGWQTVHRFAIDAGDGEGLGAKQYSPGGFVRYLLNYNHSAWITVSLLATPWVASPWREQVARILQLLG